MEVHVKTEHTLRVFKKPNNMNNPSIGDSARLDTEQLELVNQGSSDYMQVPKIVK